MISCLVAWRVKCYKNRVYIEHEVGTQIHTSLCVSCVNDRVGPRIRRLSSYFRCIKNNFFINICTWSIYTIKNYNSIIILHIIICEVL